ncbi:hypothetical protein DAPPUDRAFT_222588 [Daphnia pulex]|uniref:Chitin-binding type-2 domain-containing protein n=1 Tax=Daphnia pulex TaxID=6669 RepID=E9G4Q8_DAPPU|nr:hypothetical protein DAPPUDRAFT_222588 [Daphnia pulex]|eukprot:EFX85343.1 hypothetical protein DAPPUDRAFT_222588 [Daphnia pulex]
MQTTPSVETTMNTQSTATNPESTAMTTTILTTSTIPSEPTTTTTTSTSTTSVTTTVTTAVTTEVPTTTISASFTCPDTSEKKYPDPENPCNGKYYQCSGGIATLTDCQENLIFNSKAQLCTPCSLVPACAAECDK